MLMRPGSSSPLAMRAAMLSPAFLSTLVRAWEISRPSPSKYTASLGVAVEKVMAGLATRCRNTACCNSSWAFSRRITGVGMRAKEENSSTMRPISPTWRTMVSVHCWKISGSVTISAAYLRFSRSAESWMGVSGFLISCALRRHQVGDIVEGKDKAVGAALFGGDLHAERTRTAAPLDDDFAAGPPHRF